MIESSSISLVSHRDGNTIYTADSFRTTVGFINYFEFNQCTGKITVGDVLSAIDSYLKDDNKIKYKYQKKRHNDILKAQDKLLNWVSVSEILIEEGVNFNY
jgi:hypothetical protein